MERSEETIFAEALERKTDEDRAAFLDAACAGDPELRRNVESLLEAYAEGEFLESPAPGIGATIDQPITEKPGTQIGPYKLLQQIGEGGMGVVYMAEQKEPVKRRVALKIIKPGMDTRQVIARFEAERQALAMMDHPNIAKVLDAGATDSGRPYFVMELVNGIAVTQYCDEQHLTPKERLELFLPICQAVQHAHQKGVIHRDLKPSNVMIALYDDRVVPKVIDFGVAKATSQTLTDKTLFTQLGQVVGTLEYMSPEQAQRNQLDIDTRSDIYSLGVLLYELLTGDTPFDRQRLRSAAYDEMLRIIREEEPLKPSTKVSGSESLASIAANRKIEPAKLSLLVRGELDWIVMKALEKDRGRRYATATSFAEDIQHYLNDEAVVACPPSARYRFRKFVRRNRPLIATGSLVTAALVLGLVGTTWQAIRANNQSLRATSAEKLAKQRLQREQDSRIQVSLQRDRALVAEKAAQARFQIATEAVEHYLDEVSSDPELENGNFHELRKRLLESAVPFYEKLIEEKPQDRGQRIARGKAFIGLWNLEHYYFSNFDAAFSHAERALKVFQQLAVETPGDGEIRPYLANSHTLMGMALQTTDHNSEDARQHFEQAIQIAQQLMKEFPEEVAYQNLLANTTGNWANYVGSEQEMEQVREKAVTLYEQLSVKFPEVPEYRDKIAFYLNNSDELPRLQRSLEIREQLCRDYPGVTKYRDRVAVSLRTVAHAYRKEGKWDQAREHFEKGLELRTTLASELAVPNHKYELALVHRGLGVFFQDTSKPDQAREHYDQANQLLESLVKELKGVTRFRDLLISVQCDLGKDYYRTGEWQAALESLEKADQMRDGGINWHRFVMAMAHWQLGGQDTARTVYWDAVSKTALGNDNKELQGFRNEAEQLLGINTEERVAFEVDKLTELIEADADHLEALRGRAEIHKNTKQWAKAIDDYSNLIRLRANETNAYRDRYTCYREIGEYDSALADITRAIELKPDNEWFYQKRASLRIFNMKQFDEGIADCDQALRIDPRNRQSYYLRGWARRLLNEYEAAIKDFSSAIDLNTDWPDIYEAYDIRGRTHLAVDKYEAAIEDFSRAIELKPNAKTYQARAETHRALKNYDAAVKDYARAIELKPNAETYQSRAKIHRKMKNYKAAVEDYARAVDLAPNVSTSYQLRADTYRIMQDYEASLADFSRAIELAPKNDAYYAARAHVCITYLGKHREGIADCDEALRIDPKNFNALLNRARAHARLGEHDAAINDAAAGFKLSPDSVLRRNVLALVFRTSGTTETLEEFKELKEYFASVESDTQKTQE